MCDSANTGCFFTRSKENGRSVPDLTASPLRAPPGQMHSNQTNMSHNQQHHNMQQQQQQQQLQRHGSGVKEPVLLQGDFRKVSGISSEIFRQIEAVENDHDPSTAAALESVERRGEMIVRVLEPRCIGSRHAVETAQKLMAKGDARHSVQLVEIVKRPGQTLGLYIREGNGADRSDGVFISRIALESAVYNSGCLRVGDEILAVNLVDVTRMSLDDVVIIMSIPRRLVLAIRQRRGGRGGANSPGPPQLSRPEMKPPPVVVIKRDLRDEEMDEPDGRVPRSRSSRERRTGDGREMTESRSRLGLGLNNYSPQSEQLDLYYNSRPNAVPETPNWGYKAPPPPSVITEQPKGAHAFQPSSAYYQNAGTLESLAEKVHSFYPGQSRRMSAGTGTGVAMSQSHSRFPRSGSDQHLPRVEYSDYSSSLGRHSLLRTNLKAGVPITGGTLGRYGRYEQPPPRTSSKYGPPMPQATGSLARRPRPALDYSSDTEATIGARSSYYYYNNARPTLGSSTLGRGSTAALGGGPDFAKFNSLPRDRPGARMGLRNRIGDRLQDDSDGNMSAPEYSLPGRRDNRGGADIRNRMSTSPSIFTSDEYRAWLRRAPSSSAICEQMRASRDILNQQRAHRFSCSAENIQDALKHTEAIYSNRPGLSGTLDRHITGPRGISALPVRSLSSQHLGGPSIRSPSVRRIRQLLELGAASPGSGFSGTQSPAPTPSTTLPRQHRQIDINPAEFVKYKLDKPVFDATGMSGMLWIHLLAGRGLRAAPEGTQTVATAAHHRDLYCVLECDRIHKARTVVRSGDLQFDWDESFELDLVCNKQLDVLVYSWDPQHRHKLCYRGALSLSSILRQSPIHQLALKVEPRGTIYIRIRHTDPLQLYRRRGLPNLRGGVPALFGADLETVVTREAKGAPGSAPVPIVLRRCVEEVERRGLDIIGLYRLCGSATKKRLLREAFERNSRAVELSPDHVPDINVITGVLKDYLRELPEPLFTKCLFQMTVDALGVCLPDDPEGNAKLMLSILDCLPRANRATLVFLLDHLSLVVSASERNKMSAQALATALGPPLMLHSPSVVPGSEIDHAQPIAVLKYLLQIWPQPQQSVVSGRRGEPAGPRGNKANVLQVAKQQPANNLLHSSNSAANIQSIERLQRSVTPNSHQYQSAVAPLVPLHRVSQTVVPQLPLLAGSVGSVERGRSPQPQHVTPSPSSSSSSATSSSGSGTDTIKRGASPATSITSISTAKFRESTSNYSIKQQTNEPNVSSTTSMSKSLMATKLSAHDDVQRNRSSSDDSSPSTTSKKDDKGPNSFDYIPSRTVLFTCSDVASTTQSVRDSLKALLSTPITTSSTASATSMAVASTSLASTTNVFNLSSYNNKYSSSSSGGSGSGSGSSIGNDKQQHQITNSINTLLYGSSAATLSQQLRNQFTSTSTMATPASATTTTASSDNYSYSSSARYQVASSSSTATTTASSDGGTSYSLNLSKRPPPNYDDAELSGSGTESSSPSVPTATTASASSSASIGSPSPLRKASSPSRTINNTSTLPLTLGRHSSSSSSSSNNNGNNNGNSNNNINNNLMNNNISNYSKPSSASSALFQPLTESNYNNSSLTSSNSKTTRQDLQFTNYTSPGISYASSLSSSTTPSTTSTTTSASSTYTPSTNTYGTIPKTMYQTQSQYYAHFSQQPPSSTSTIKNGDNGESTFTYIAYNSANGSNTVGSYKVQYPSTNPFLQNYDPPAGEGSSVSPIPTINLSTADSDEDLK